MDQAQYCQSERSIDHGVLSSPLLMEALWVGVDGKKRGAQCERGLQEGYGLPGEGEGALGQDVKILLTLEMAGSYLFI